jgi:hypothetical protein
VISSVIESACHNASISYAAEWSPLPCGQSYTLKPIAMEIFTELHWDPLLISETDSVWRTKPNAPLLICILGGVCRGQAGVSQWVTCTLSRVQYSPFTINRDLLKRKATIVIYSRVLYLYFYSSQFCRLSILYFQDPWPLRTRTEKLVVIIIIFILHGPDHWPILSPFIRQFRYSLLCWIISFSVKLSCSYV